MVKGFASSNIRMFWMPQWFVGMAPNDETNNTISKSKLIVLVTEITLWHLSFPETIFPYRKQPHNLSLIPMCSFCLNSFFVRKLISLTFPPCRRLYISVKYFSNHYDDVIMGAMASQITSLTTVYSTVYSGADQRKPQSEFPHKCLVTWKMFPFDDVILLLLISRRIHFVHVSTHWGMVAHIRAEKLCNHWFR